MSHAWKPVAAKIKLWLQWTIKICKASLWNLLKNPLLVLLFDNYKPEMIFLKDTNPKSNIWTQQSRDNFTLELTLVELIFAIC